MDNAQIRQRLADRYNHKRELGIPVDPRGSSAQQDIDSGFAEKFACDELGCEFNCDVFDGNDGGYDFIYKGKKFDVKWLGFTTYDNTPRNKGRIIVDMHKIGRADCYIAVAGSEKEGYHCVGWCTKEDLLNTPTWRSNYPDDNGVYERYAVHTDNMRKMKDLKNDSIQI